MSNCLIICDGLLTKKLLGRFIRKAEPRNMVIISCDGASEFLRKHNVTPKYIVGDLDSVTPGTLAFYKRRKVIIKKYSSQYKNDLEKALDLALQKKFKNISIIGLTGKRFDHSINNLSIIKRYYKKAAIKLYDNDFEMMIINKSTRLTCKKGDIISLIPLPVAYGVKTSGLKYQLNNETIIFGKREGALNKAVNELVMIEIKKGELLVMKQQ